MNSLLDVTWLVPAFPLGGGIIIALLLVSFNRTMNRLTKPVTFLLINSIAFSTILSVFLYVKHVSGKLFDWHIHIAQIDLFRTFSLVYESSIYLIAIGILFFLVLLVSYYRLPRSTGYIRYITCLSILCGLLFLFVLDNDLFKIISF